MIFVGIYEHNIDNKNRLVLPSRFVNKLDKTICVSKGFNDCLENRSKESFEAHIKCLLSHSNTPNVRSAQRMSLSLTNKIRGSSRKIE
jgi:MraZ protein